MPFQSMLTSLTLLLFVGVAGCKGYQYQAFEPREKTNTSHIAYRGVIKKSVAKKSVPQKSPLISKLDFDPDQENLVEDTLPKPFPAQDQRETSWEKSIVEEHSVAISELKPKTVTDDAKASHNRLVSHIREESNPFISHVESSIPPAPGSEQKFSEEEKIPFGLKSHPIDLPATLRLAGAKNWNVLLAVEQINEASARQEKAKTMWIPSLNAGIGYTKHEGKIQATDGQIIDISRNSLFVGGGAITGDAPPLTGGAGGPARLALDLSLTDAIFAPLAECQLYNASRSNYSAAFNDTLLEASLGYYDLVRAQGNLAITKKNLQNAEELFNLTSSFVSAGKGSLADVSRAAVEVNQRKQSIIEAELTMQIASTTLVRILQLDPEEMGAQTLLVALEEQPLPVSLVEEATSLDELISQGHTYRPELNEQTSRMEANRIRARAEHWRPYLPNLHMGTSAGGFGGGVGNSLDQLDGRSDVDLLAVWQIENLGFGTRARRRQTNSVYHQSVITTNRTYDIVSADVINARNSVLAQRRQIQLAEENIKRAVESYDQNMARIRGLAGLPLEGLQSLDAVANAREAYLNSIIAYNQAQLTLLRAIGLPPGMHADSEDEFTDQ